MMRLTTTVLAVMCGLAAPAASAQSRVEVLRSDFLNPDVPRIFSVAHRACWRDAPENSLRALNACIDLGVDLVEMDVRVTADGVPVVFHDSTLIRMTGREGRLADTDHATLREIGLLHGAGGEGAPVTTETVPSLAEVLRAARGRILVHLDLKGGRADEAAVWRVVQAEDAEAVVLMKIVQPPEDAAWRDAPFLGRSLVRSRIGQESAPDLEERLCTLQGRGLAAHTVMFADLDYVRDVRATRARCGDGRLWVATQRPEYAGGLTDDLALVDPDATWGRLIALGFTVLETDRPEALIAYLRQRDAVAPTFPSDR